MWALTGGRCVVLCGGHGGQAFDDNGRAIALHLGRDERFLVIWVCGYALRRALPPERGVRFVVKASPMRLFWLWLADFVIVSHGISDVAFVMPPVDRHAQVVNLGHGVLGLKRIERLGNCDSSWIDYMISVSKTEQGLKEDVWGVSRDRVWPIGLPKHDALVTASRNSQNVRKVGSITIFMTWRDWLKTSPTDRGVEHYLEGIKLAVAVARKVHPLAAIRIIVHKNIARLKNELEAASGSGNVEVLRSTEVDVQLELLAADVILTDYSGVFWDAVVLGRACCRFVFDLVIYDYLVGSYEGVFPDHSELIAADSFELERKLEDVQCLEKNVRHLREEMFWDLDGGACDRFVNKLVETCPNSGNIRNASVE